MKKILVMAVITCLMLASGCTKTSPPIKPRPEHRPPADRQVIVENGRAEQVKALAGQIKAVEDSKAVVVDRDIVLAIKVTGFSRLRIESIREKARDRIKSSNPGFSVYLTSDKKLFRQLQQLEKDARQPGPLIEFRARVNKVISDM